jgi:hypothetical protein
VEGSVKLIFISLFFILFLFPKKLWLLGNKILNLKEILFHSALCFGMMIFGWISFSTLFESIYLLIPYYFAIVSCMFIFQFTLVLDANNGTWDVASWDKKQFNLTLSFLMMMVAVSLGIIFDDPMISTAAMVSSPYALIAIIWPKHVRHLQRARFYPVLTFSLFLCVRAPWFIVPLVILFFMLRTTNYFRFGIAYPSFAVDFLDKES